MDCFTCEAKSPGVSHVLTILHQRLTTLRLTERQDGNCLEIKKKQASTSNDTQNTSTSSALVTPPYAADLALTNSPRNASTSWAPPISYRSLMIKCGTPWMPLA